MWKRNIAAFFMIFMGMGSPKIPEYPLPVCDPINGISGLAESEEKFIFFGEVHGTQEIPAFFGDVLCELLKVKKVVVALEWPKSSTDRIRNYLAAPDNENADAEFLNYDRIWNAAIADGRNSHAMFRLMKKIKSLKKIGENIEVAAFQPTGFNNLHHMSQDYYELVMAYNIFRIADEFPDQTVLVLTGNFHARLSPQTVGLKVIRPAAMRLPQEDVISFHLNNTGGTAWTCQSDGCKPHTRAEDPNSSKTNKREIIISKGIVDNYDGYYSLGTTYTSSCPARYETCDEGLLEQ